MTARLSTPTIERALISFLAITVPFKHCQQLWNIPRSEFGNPVHWFSWKDDRGDGELRTQPMALYDCAPGLTAKRKSAGEEAAQQASLRVLALYFFRQRRTRQSMIRCPIVM